MPKRSSPNQRPKNLRPPKARPAASAPHGLELQPASAEVLDQDLEAENLKPRNHPFSVVGIGASAGGFEAFTQLLASLRPDIGMAYVLVQHLDPSHESKLAELLARHSPIPVREVINGVKVEPNRIYVIPHNTDLRIAGGHLHLTPRTDRGPHMPVDWFLRSLAREYREAAIGVILSGNGSDGTLGIQEIKGAGGITFAQDEKTAKFFGMPAAAIASGSVDFVLPPEVIAQDLGRVAGHPLLGPRKGAAGGSTDGAGESEHLFKENEDELGAIFALLRSQSGVDFSLYKPSTLKRRILRRIVLHKHDALPPYLKLLRSNPAEADALFHDLLISVTSFFRDPPVFGVLKKKIFPKLLKRPPSDAPLRIWVCGCSTGQEPYSLAMALLEAMEENSLHRDVQIFATDVNDQALERARAGLYPENIQLDVSPERIRRFFNKTNGNYQINKTIRDMCIFARQNVLADPPFSHLDLISCRNVLIYFGAVLQRKVLPTFHYALRREGFLLLGSSEAVSASSDLFSLVDKRSKIYGRRNSAYHHDPFLSPAPPSEERTPHRPATVKELLVGSKAPDVQEHMDRLILSRISPAAVVINQQMEVLQFRGRTGLYLEHAPGTASLNLLKMAHENLILSLRTAIATAIRSGVPVKQGVAHARHHGLERQTSIEVVPFHLTPSTECFYLVIFDELVSPGTGHAAGAGGKGARKAKNQKEHQARSRLADELSWTRESLQAIIEEQEATNEELKSANEEIQSSNEELQSTNEELETAKEELQSTNEELTTLNEELQNRNNELGLLNNDLTNLLASVNIAIIMLGGDLTVRRFTPMAERIFNLIPSDVGRRLSDMNRSIVVPDLDQLIRQVIDELTFVDREVQDGAGHSYSLRIRPYRTRENKIDGAVLLLVDIEEQKRTVEEIMTMVNQPLLALDEDLRVKTGNPAFYQKFGGRPADTEKHLIYELGNGQWNLPQLRTLLEQILPRDYRANNFRVETAFPALGRRTLVFNARKLHDENKGAPLILLAIDELAVP